MKQPKIAQLRNKISFISKSKTQNPDFTYSETEIEDFYVWGQIVPKSGFIFNPNDDHESLSVTHTITIRYDTNVKSTHILRSGELKFKIIASDPLIYGKVRFMVLKCEQIGDSTLGTC